MPLPRWRPPWTRRPARHAPRRGGGLLGATPPPRPARRGRHSGSRGGPAAAAATRPATSAVGQPPRPKSKALPSTPRGGREVGGQPRRGRGIHVRGRLIWDDWSPLADTGSAWPGVQEDPRRGMPLYHTILHIPSTMTVHQVFDQSSTTQNPSMWAVCSALTSPSAVARSDEPLHHAFRLPTFPPPLHRPARPAIAPPSPRPRHPSLHPLLPLPALLFPCFARPPRRPRVRAGVSPPAAAMVAEGDAAPDFTATDCDGEPFTLSAVTPGRPVVLYFYPKSYVLVAVRWPQGGGAGGRGACHEAARQEWVVRGRDAFAEEVAAGGWRGCLLGADGGAACSGGWLAS